MGCKDQDVHFVTMVVGAEIGGSRMASLEHALHTGIQVRRKALVNVGTNENTSQAQGIPE